jgi:hypothetical protein
VGDTIGIVNAAKQEGRERKPIQLDQSVAATAKAGSVDAIRPRFLRTPGGVAVQQPAFFVSSSLTQATQKKRNETRTVCSSSSFQRDFGREEHVPFGRWTLADDEEINLLGSASGLFRAILRPGRAAPLIPSSLCLAAEMPSSIYTRTHAQRSSRLPARASLPAEPAMTPSPPERQRGLFLSPLQLEAYTSTSSVAVVLVPS